MLKLVLKKLWHPVPWNRKKQHVHRFPSLQPKISSFHYGFWYEPIWDLSWNEFHGFATWNEGDCLLGNKDTKSWRGEMCTFFSLFSMRLLQTHCTESQLFVLLLKYLLRLALAKVSFNFMKGAYNSPLWWMQNSVCMGFDTAMKTGSSRWLKQYPTTYMWVSSWLPFTVD